jgi:ribulose 1,5-bisphosphate synthetase/thiazole synthase
MKLKRDRVVLADWFLRKYGFQNTIEKISQNNWKNVVIIGGSASGFSCAWMLLHGPAIGNEAEIQLK